MSTKSTLQLNDQDTIFNNSDSLSNEWINEYSFRTEIKNSEFPLYRRCKWSPHICLEWGENLQKVLLPKLSFYTVIGKRIFDLVISILVVVFILSWMIPLIGTIILIESPGPFFFFQTRSGRKGVPFICIKFRSMRICREKAKFQQTAQDDARVTRVGRFLRKTNLDEMPQFINVLIGDMSVVGPRPHALQHDALHWSSAAYRERYIVRPGITGLAQVRGARGATGHHQKMDHRIRYDHLYIPRQSFMFDIKICYETLKLMYRGDKNAW